MNKSSGDFQKNPLSTQANFIFILTNKVAHMLRRSVNSFFIGIFICLLAVSTIHAQQQQPTVLGQWALNANGYVGKLEFHAEGAGFTGRIWYDAHQKWEELANIGFDARSGVLHFTRPGPSQNYTGWLEGHRISGTFDQGGGGNYQWQASLTSQFAAASPAPEAQTGQPAAIPANAPAKTIFNNWNKSTVNNSPTRSTQFNLGQTTTITSIMNYHWNNGRGQAAGTIHLVGGDGQIHGPWQAVGTSGTGGAQSVNWIVKPNVTLAPGSYLIVDSDHATWSRNAISNGAGFSNVSGR